MAGLGLVVATVLLLVARIGVSSAQDTNQDCLYRYLQQPPIQLGCNPYGSRLQLQCVASGPPSSSFSLQWFMQQLLSSGTTGTEVGTAPPTAVLPSQGFNIQNLVHNNGSGNERITSSILTKDRVDASICFWCELAVSGYQPSRSNVLCILAEANYGGVNDCANSAIFAINSSRVCVQLSRAANPPNTPPANVEPTHPTPHISGIQATSSSDDVLESTHFGDSSIQVSSDMPMVNTNSDTQRLEALYVAVAICAVFIVIIAVMVVTILIMCRRKPCTKAILYSQKYMSNGNGNGQVLRNAFNGPTEANFHRATNPTSLALSEPGSHLRNGYGLAASEPDLLRMQRYEAERKPSGNEYFMRTISLEQDCSERDKLVLRPFNPVKHSPHKFPDYDHLEPLKGAKKPHYYYTLERSDEHSRSTGDIDRKGSTPQGGVSPTYAQPNIKKGLTDTGEYDEVVVHGNGALRELFDDPKYALIFLKAKKKDRRGKTTQVSASPSATNINTQTKKPPAYYPHSRSSENLSLVKANRSQWPSPPITPPHHYSSQALSSSSQPDLPHAMVNARNSRAYHSDRHCHRHYKRPQSDSTHTTVSVPVEVHAT